MVGWLTRVLVYFICQSAIVLAQDSSQVESKLDWLLSRLYQVRLGYQAFEALQEIDSSIACDTKISQIVSDHYFRKYFPRARDPFYEDERELRIRAVLAMLGIPLNMTTQEMAEFALNPGSPRYHRLQDLSFEKHASPQDLNRIVPILERKAQIHLIFDFFKVYREQRKLNYAHLGGIGFGRMETVNKTVQDYLKQHSNERIVNLDKLILRPETVAKIEAAAIPRQILESELRHYPFTLDEQMEIGLSLQVRSSQNTTPLRRVCAAVILRLRGEFDHDPPLSKFKTPP